MKKRMIIILSISILCVGIVVAFILWKQKQKPADSSSMQPQTQNRPSEESALWEDQAGFTFNYPKTLSFDKHDEDQENYAHIEFKSSTHSGRLIVWAKDTTYPDVSVWVTKDASLSGAVNVDTTLGGQPAKKIVLSTPSKKIIIGAILDQILFTVEAEPSEQDDYWTKVSNTIVSNFAFTPLDASSTGDTSGATESYVDEEEVVE